MIPFLHIGPLTIPTYGLMVATGLLVAAYILQADFNRRRQELERYRSWKSDLHESLLTRIVRRSHNDEGFLIIGLAGIAGLIGSRLYSALESPREFWANPWPVLFSRYGLTWSGGFFAGLVVLIFLARSWKIPYLEFLDICSPAAAAGYAIGRMGCLLSGDGDYGKPTSWQWPWGMAFPHGVVPTTQTCVEWGWPADCRVYPTPVYEFLVGMAIAAFLWYLGTRALGGAKPKGEIFCYYLILTGAARFLVEFIRINPRVLYGLTNAQVVSLVSIVVGVVLVVWIKFAAQKSSEAA